MIVSDEVFEPFASGTASFAHGSTFGGHPVASAVALRNLDVFAEEDLCGHVRAKEDEFRGVLEGLRDIPMVGDVRGAGFFHAIEARRQGSRHEGVVQRRGGRVAAARLPLRRGSTGAG